ncbi:MAG: glycosyltransferase [Gimesia sp.]
MLKKILIIGDEFGFPKGYAATNYVTLLAKGFLHHSIDVKVIVTSHSDYAQIPLNTQSKGVHEGIKFEYTIGSPSPYTPSRIWRTRIGSRIRHYFPRIRLIRCLILARLSGCRHVLFYGRNYELWKTLRKLTKFLGMKLVPIIVEWTPAIPLRPLRYLAKELRFYEAAFSQADGLALISDFLIEKMHYCTCSPPPLFKIPILCHAGMRAFQKDLEQTTSSLTESSRYIAYCADHNGYKSDTIFVINSFAEARVDGLHLKLIGKCSPATNKELTEIVTNLGLSGLVHIHSEYIETEQLKHIYADSELLLLPMENSDRNRARFPSKIADYLLSGTAVLCHRVGEVANYLKDNKNVYFCDHWDVKEFGRRIHTSIHDSNRENIGQSGLQVAASEFDCDHVVADLQAFLKTLG